MKKALAFICSSLMILATYIIFSSVVGALEPTLAVHWEPTEANVRAVHESLKLLAQDPGHQVCPDDNACYLNMDSINMRYSLDDTAIFERVCDVYSSELQNLLSMCGRPIELNCHAFASYAFKRYKEKGVHCQYLRISYEGEDVSPLGKKCGLIHDVVLIPQVEKGTTISYYVCDFQNAMTDDKRDAVLLFVPLIIYLRGINMGPFGRIKEMMVIPCDDPSFFNPRRCLDARIWFCKFGNSERAALDIIELERCNGLMMNLKIGALLSEKCQEYTHLLQSLYFKVDPIMGLDYGNEVNRRIFDMIKNHPELLIQLMKK